MEQGAAPALVASGHFGDAYCGPALGPAATLGHWNLDPLLIVAIIGLAAVYWRTRSPDLADDRPAVALGALALVLYVSPFCAAGASLFLVRVLHHLALALVAAPLAAGLLASRLRRAPGGLTLWTVVAATAMWAWHSPGLYDWAAADAAGYWLMQASIFGSALMFWDRLARAPGPAAIAALLAAMVAMGALGAVITLVPDALYPAHFATTAAWGLSPLEDQQVAGLIMWAPASAIYLVAALLLVRRLFATGTAA